MRTSAAVNQANRRTTLTQSLSGGLTYDAATGSVQLNNRTNVGRAGLLFYAYLDLNGNCSSQHPLFQRFLRSNLQLMAM